MSVNSADRFSMLMERSPRAFVFGDYAEFLKQSKQNFEKKYGSPTAPPAFALDDFDVVKTVGVGSFSKVVLVRAKETGTFHALKVMAKEAVVAASAQQYILRERHILCAVAYPFIVQALTTFQDNSNLYICMPFANGGDMFNLLKVQEQLSEKSAIFYLAQIVLCIEFLHYLGLIYRDLKPENVLLDGMGYIRLTDFGFSRKLNGRTYTFCGTPEYMAPEIVLGKGYGRGVDWWALGVLAHEMVAGRVPFQASDPTRLYEKILRGRKVPLPAAFSLPFRSFVEGLLEFEPTRRLGCLKKGADEVKTHPWMQGMDWPALLDRSLTPPIVPKVKGPGDFSHYDNFDDVVFVMEPEDKYAKYFQEF